jgi:hypothetical protein
VDGFIDHLYKRLISTSNYNVTINPTIHESPQHQLSILRFAFTIRFLVTEPNSGDSSAPVLTSLLSGEYPATELTESESESSVTTDAQPASLSWNKAPIWGLQSDFYYCQTVAGLLIWGAFSDERTSLSCTIAFDTRQRSHSWARIP